MRTHALWKVETHMALARGPTSPSTRSFISPAALLVKVIARIWPGWTPRAASRWPMRWVSTRVLPEPAPATMTCGAAGAVMQASCSGVKGMPRSSLSCSGSVRTDGRADT